MIDWHFKSVRAPYEHIETMLMNKISTTVILALISCSLKAQQDAAGLAQKVANPISSLISVPFQNNSDYGIGDLKGSRNTMNIQPVVPLSLNKELNLIMRIIMSVTTQYNITGPAEKQ